MQCCMAEIRALRSHILQEEGTLYTRAHEYTVSWRLIFQSLGLPFSDSETEWSVILCLRPHKVYDQLISKSWCKPHFSSIFSCLLKFAQQLYSLMSTNTILASTILFKGSQIPAHFCSSLKQQIQYFFFDMLKNRHLSTNQCVSSWVKHTLF